jgi:hypothetical protein
MLSRVREGALTHGNIRNEPISGDVHENMGEHAGEI